MVNRLDLSEELHKLCDNVYFEPPEGKKLRYDAIVYNRVMIDTRFADNKPYLIHDAYELIVISDDPECDIPGKLVRFPMCRFVRHFVNDNLYHDVFRIYL